MKTDLITASSINTTYNDLSINRIIKTQYVILVQL